MKRFVNQFLLVFASVCFSINSSAQDYIELGSGTSSSSNNTITPWTNFYEDGRKQFLFTASELSASGLNVGDEINALAFNIYSAVGQATNLSIGLKSTSQTTFSNSTFESGLFNNFSGIHTAATGWDQISFSSNYVWDGNGIIVEFCYNNSTFTGNSLVYYSSTSHVSNRYAYTDRANGCTLNSFGSNSNRPNLRFYIETVNVASILRNNPLSASSTANNVQFKVNFTKDVLAVDTSDFVLNGSAASNTDIQSVSKVNGSQYLVDITTTNPTSGTIGLDIKGVDASGSNNIIEDNLVLDQQSLADIQITDSKIFGQSFTAGNSGLLYKVTIKKGQGHSYSGNGTMDLISGNGYLGTVLASEAISVNSSLGEVSYQFSNPAAITSGNAYTIRFNFPNAPSRSTAFSAQVGAGYGGGELYQATAFPSADLYFKTYLASSIKLLSSAPPSTDEVYNYIVPLQVSTTVDSNQTNSSMPNGGASVSVTGGLPPYVVQWSHGPTSNTVTNLSSGKYYVTVSDYNGSSASITQTVVDSVEIEKINSFNLTSILRNNPTDFITTQANLQFKLNFSDEAANYTLSDFIAIGELANSLVFNSVVYDTDSTCLVNTTLLSSVDGTIGVGIKGVGGLAGTNGITSIILADTITVDQSSTNDYLNQSMIGQTYTAIKENLKGIVIFPKSGNHSFNGSVDLKVYSGDQSLGGHSLIHSETVSLSNNTAATGQAFELSNLVSTTPGNTYTIVFENFNGSGSQALLSATNGTYGGGHVVFTGFNPVSHSNFDLKIKITEAFEGIGELLDTVAPVMNQSYQYNVPLLLESIRRYHPIDSVTTQPNLQFKLSFNQAVGNYVEADFIGVGQLADSLLIDSVNYLSDSSFLVNTTLNSSINGSIGIGVKGLGGQSGTNGIKSFSIVDTLSVDQSYTDDYLNQSMIGQTYTAINENLKEVVIYPKSGNHSFYGTADLKVYSGDYSTGNHSLLHSETVVISNSTAAVGQAFELSNLVSTAAGNTYSIIFDNISGSGSHALESAISGTYPNGHVIFSNYNSGSHSNFDLKIKIIEASQVFDKNLDTLTPSLIQSYQYTIPCQPTSSIQIESVCDTYTWPLNGMTYTSSGMYKDTIPNAAGCDSLMTLNLIIRNETSETFTADVCNSYDWQGMTFTQSGTYYDTIPNAAGCDSLMTLNLIIRNETSETFSSDVCNSYDWQGMTFTASGTYYDTIQNAAGCDSLMTLNLIIRNETSETFSADVCNSYDWQGMTFTQSGTYYDTIPNTAGCDSLMTLNLTIRNETSETFTADVCNSYAWQGMTFTQSGTYYDTIPNAAGCDSLMTLNLVIRNETSEIFTADVCNTYDWQGMTFTQSGTYYDTIPNAVGCDSLMTLNLIIRNETSETFTADVCNSYDWQGMTFTTSGTYYDTIPNAVGCDSLMTLNLVIRTSTGSVTAANECNSYQWQGMTFTQSGTYFDTIPNAAGCDSLMTLNLIIRNETSETFTADVCNSYDWQGMTFTASGTYYDTIPNAAGCDSLMTLNLIIRNETSETFTADVCNSYDWQGMTFTTSGTYYDTIPNAVGCDSLMTLNLTINNTVRDTNLVTACDSYVWSSNGMLYTTNGIYSDTLMAANGCDSISSIDLTINQSTSSIQVETACNTYLWSQNGMSYTSTGMYKDTIPNAAGCDSVITLDLTINNTVRDTNLVTACDSYVWSSNGMTYTSSGIYSDTLTAANGCDSISSIDLMLSISTSSMQVMTSCDSYLWPQNSMTYTVKGLYYDTIPNAAGCDSVITLDLTIDTIDTRVVQNGFDLIAQTTNPNATFQWVDCTADTAILGATSSSYTVTANGNYSVEISENNCIDTSACISVLNVGLESTQNGNSWFNIYPNPTKDLVNVEVSEFIHSDKMQIYNLQGEMIKELYLLGEETKVSLEGIASGIYFVRYHSKAKKLIVRD